MRVVSTPVVHEKRKAAPPARPSKVTVPARANPLAKLVFHEMKTQNVTYAELEWRSGVLTQTFKAWRGSTVPSLTAMQAALGALGWELLPVQRAAIIPEWVSAELDKIAHEWAAEEPQLLEVLSNHCTAPLWFREFLPATEAAAA